MKNILIIGSILFSLLGTSPIIFAQETDPSVVVTPKAASIEPCIGAECTYELLEPLPGLSSVDQSTNIGKWVNTMVRIIIGIIGIIAVVMIVVGGIQYMTTDAIGKKESGKETIQGAIFGVILALGAYILLRTINPQLVSLDLQPGTAKTGGVSIQLPADLAYIQDSGDSDSGSLNIGALPKSIVCPKPAVFDSTLIPKIAQSFVNQTVYRFGGKGGPPPYQDASKWQCPAKSGNQCSASCPTGKACLDCSGFVNIVLSCAGKPGVAPAGGIGTASIFNSQAEKVDKNKGGFSGNSFNGIELRPGDLIGFPSTGNKIGHVVMYIGNGKTVESAGGQSGRDTNSVIIQSIKSGWKTNDNIYVRRISK